MSTCMKCLLNDNIPTVRINTEGLCNYCVDTYGLQNNVCDTDKEFEELLKRYKERKYQVAMAFSGGKDSTYTLKLIREKYDASILAITFNNGFISDSSIKNINAVTDYLGVDNIIVKYPGEKLIRAFKFAADGSIFPRISLERASSICNLCIMLIKNMIFYEAIARDIPIICFGWTPGQVETAKPLIRLNYRTVSRGFDNVKNAITGNLGDEYGRYFLDAEFMKENEDKMPYLYYPFVKNAYKEDEIVKQIKQIGWEYPDNTDGNSSNCLLNSYANQCHVEQFGYHPYAFEISNMVRGGYMSRGEGALKLEKVKNEITYEAVKQLFEKY